MPTTLTLKNIPDTVYARLKAAAEMHRRSLNSEAIVCLESVLVSAGEQEPDSERVLELVRGSNCSAYDCEFIAVANALDTKLVTMDAKLLKEFPKVTKSLAAPDRRRFGQRARHRAHAREAARSIRSRIFAATSDSPAINAAPMAATISPGPGVTSMTMPSAINTSPPPIASTVRIMPGFERIRS